MVRSGNGSGGGSGGKAKKSHEVSKDKRPRGRPPTTPLGIDSGKSNKVNTMEVTQHILSRFMTEDPLGVTDLQRTLPGIPKDIVQGCIDVLQVLGIVIQIEDVKVHNASTVPLELPSAATPSSSTPKAAVLVSNNVPNQANKSNIVTPRQTTTHKYALVGFAKAPEYTDITTISELMEAKEHSISLIKERIKKLQEISLNNDVNVDDRRSLLKEQLQQSVAQDPVALKADALYSNLLELL